MLITVPQAARLVGRNPETIRRWIWSGRLASQRVGTQHLVEEDEVHRIAAAPAGSRAWSEWLDLVDRMHEESPVDDAVFDTVGDILDEVRRGR
ncbi:MAG: helix-turn-helix domain-containing protein [Actinomycetota bacterium]